jgi:hypothetical protein
MGCGLTEALRRIPTEYEWRLLRAYYRVHEEDGGTDREKKRRAVRRRREKDTGA